MTISIWRYGHLVLAILSSAFLFLASITGAVLAVEPIHNNMFSYNIENSDDLPLSNVISVVKDKYTDVLSLKRDKNGFVILEVIADKGSGEFYINPFTGKKIGELIKQNPIFKFMTGLHRSLFLHSLGRAFIGVTAFILFFIAISGVVLILKRQNSIKGFFSKIIKENASQYFHIFFGRLTLIPIMVLSLTGTYLSMQRFKIIPKESLALEIPENASEDINKIESTKIMIFNQTTLSDFRELLFPLFEDVEEFYHLKLKKKEVYVNQFTGNIESQQEYSITSLASRLSFNLHTGQGSILWSLILGLSMISIPYFIYSGFAMTLNRRKGSIKNIYKKDNSEYIILVGSENGSTRLFAKMLHEALLKADKTSYLSELNHYGIFKKIQNLIVLTSTYGQGDAPTNASKFLQLFEDKNIKDSFKYAVVGFGSLSYPDFCKFAYDVDGCINETKKHIRLLDVHTVNNGSFESFSQWATQWGKKEGIHIQLPKDSVIVKRKKTIAFKMVQKTKVLANQDDTFLVELKPKKRKTYKSGDLLAIYPKGDNQERLYSMATLKNTILLSIKKHEMGVCSNYLNNLKLGESIEGYIIKNKEFHYPKKATKTIMIATGTGIAPFLGMIENNHKKQETHLYWGAKNETSFALYKNIINNGLNDKRLTKYIPAYSRIGKDKVYVQNLIEKDHKMVMKTLKNKGVIMICGSITMQKEIIKILNKYSLEQNKKPISHYKNNNQIKIDCY